MKLKLMLAACLGAAVFPMAAAGAAEGIPGTCTTIEIYGGNVTTTRTQCECLAFVWPPEFYGGRIVLKYCTVNIDRGSN